MPHCHKSEKVLVLRLDNLPDRQSIFFFSMPTESETHVPGRYLVDALDDRL